MPAVIALYNLLEPAGLEALGSSEPERLLYRPEGGAYLNLMGLPLEPLPAIDERKIAQLCRVVRGLAFAAVDAAKSGHPGGSSSKAEQVLTLLSSGTLGFDALHPKHPGRDRIVWSAGHCTPLFHAVVALTYDTLRSNGVSLAAEAEDATETMDRIHLNFALGKALEDAGAAEDAWRHYARGNALQRAASQYRAEILETNTRLQTSICTAAFFAAREGWGAPAPDPIFVLGLPRSGSTLIEQILASHRDIEGTQELPDIQRIVLELQGREHDVDNPRYPGSLAELTPGQCRALGERYLAETRAHRLLGRAFFIDKMPNNFRHIGLIHLILPNARIIDARRDPMACCFSNLKQLFAQGQEFTYSAQDIARYYRTYLDLMRHWDTALPGRVLRVIHEDVIEDLEGQVRRLLDHCGLPFDPACLTFHQNRRAVRTPSSEQVRRPIFRDGLDQWRAFEPFLDDLKAHLGDALTDWRR